MLFRSNRTRYTPDKRHPKHRIVCTVCGTPHESARPDGKYCSDDCRAVDYAKRGIRPKREPGWTWTRRARAKFKLRKAACGIRGSRWAAGSCERCGTPFVSVVNNDIGRYCSDACKRRASKSRRRARKRGAYSEPYSRHQIFERDRWRCHICRRKTSRTKVVPHPRAPVIDHLVPLAEGGDDTAANVATACFLCNSTKRDAGGGEQLALIG